MSCDRWQVTGDRWQVTGDKWHITHGEVNILSKLQLSSSKGLGVMMSWRSGGKLWVTHLINDNDKAFSRTAPATPGLLIMVENPTKLEENMKIIVLQN